MNKVFNSIYELDNPSLINENDINDENKKKEIQLKKNLID